MRTLQALVIVPQYRECLAYTVDMFLFDIFSPQGNRFKQPVGDDIFLEVCDLGPILFPVIGQIMVEFDLIDG